MASALTNRSIRLSLIDAFLYSLMMGAGESYLPAYSFESGLGEVAVGILASLPMLSGAILQMFSGHGLKWVGSHKTWVVITTSLQGFSFLPLIILAYTHVSSFWSLFFVYTIYWASGYAAAPAWNYWMNWILKDENTTAYLNLRMRVSQVGILLGLVGGGLLLKLGAEIASFHHLFGLLFSFACVCRFLSSFTLSRKHFDSQWLGPGMSLSVSPRKMWASLPDSLKSFLLKMIPFQVGLFLSGPYVAPFLIAKRQFSYFEFMLSVTVFFSGKFAFSLLLPRLRKNQSNQRLFLGGAFLVSFLPIFWPFAHNLSEVLVLQTISGLAWAAFELSLQKIFFVKLKSDERVPFLSVYNLFVAFGIWFGGLLGGVFLKSLGTNLATYYSLFVIAAFVRVLFLGPLVLHKWGNRRTSILAAPSAVADSSAGIKPTSEGNDGPPRSDVA